jgi:hypothetical protein
MFATKANLSHHFSHNHPGLSRSRSVMPQRQLFQTLTMGRREERVAPRYRVEGEANQSLSQDAEVMPIRQIVERRVRRHLNPLEAGQSRQVVESERLTEYRQQRRREFRRKREEHCNNTGGGSISFRCPKRK